MAARFAPLVLPQNLDDMPTDYQSKIPLFDGTPHCVTAQQHVDRMTDFFDLHEIDAENVTMRLFVQTFGGEVRKWFRALLAASITTLTNLQRQFLDHWEVKKNPLQILSEYENIKRNVGESVQDYCIRFNLVYNAIPDQLRERDLATLEDMQKIAVSVEANLLAKRDRTKAKKQVTIKEEVSTSNQVLRKMEKMFDRLTINKSEPQVINPNFCGQQQPQFRIKQIEQRAQDQVA